MLCPKAALAWVDQLPVPHHILSWRCSLPAALCGSPLHSLSIYAFISSGDALCFSTGNTLQPLLYAPLHSYLSGPHYILTGQVHCFRSEHTLPESFRGSPVPRPCYYTAGAQMLKTTFLQHPPQLPISSACPPLCPQCRGTRDTYPPLTFHYLQLSVPH